MKNVSNTMLGLLRIVLGWTFLWAFLDKLFGLGFATKPESAWLAGGSPTAGFLTHAARGPFAEVYQSMAGMAWVDWLFMIGLLGIGLALLLGIGMKIAALTGSLLMLMMWTALLPPDNNPITDDHIINIFALLVLKTTNAGDYIGFGKQWRAMPLVQKYPILR